MGGGVAGIADEAASALLAGGVAADGGGEAAEVLPRTLMTLSLDQAASERIIFAQSNGELSFGLLTEKSKISPGPGVTAANLFE